MSDPTGEIARFGTDADESGDGRPQEDAGDRDHGEDDDSFDVGNAEPTEASFGGGGGALGGGAAAGARLRG